MDHFYIIANKNKKSAEKLQHEICEFLEAAGKTVTVAAEKAERGHIAPDGCECILVLGGDGTMLNAADDNAEGQIPLLGINLGTMGYLAEIEKDAWKEALTRLLDGNFEIEERMMLMGYVEDCPGRRTRTALQALNDVAITRSGQLRVVPYDVYVNGQFLNRYEADGIILSTPTGSTGYNLSAGGPIAEPQAKLILLTPICPHTLNTRTIILSPEDRIEIEIGKARADAAQEKARERAEAAEVRKKAAEEKKAENARKRAVKSMAGTVSGTIGREVGKQIGGSFGKFGKTLGGNIGASLGRGILSTLFKN